MDVEILLGTDVSRRGIAMLEALIQTAPASGVTTHVTNRWTRAAPILMSYGLGHPGRSRWLDQHGASGGRVVGWDLGYWGRNEGADFNMRVTIDDHHPHRWLQPESPDRFDAAGIVLRADSDPTGPIILCGLGHKQRRVRRLSGQDWERRKLADIRARYPGRHVIYHPKREEPTLRGVEMSLEPIEVVMRGASLVVCAHSNVAIDACIAGVPVECEDGAAFALYAKGSAPTLAERLEFLRSVAHWQYTPNEAGLAWDHLKKHLGRTL